MVSLRRLARSGYSKSRGFQMHRREGLTSVDRSRTVLPALVSWPEKIASGFQTTHHRSLGRTLGAGLGARRTVAQQILAGDKNRFRNRAEYRSEEHTSELQS